MNNIPTDEGQTGFVTGTPGEAQRLYDAYVRHTPKEWHGIFTERRKAYNLSPDLEDVISKVTLRLDNLVSYIYLDQYFAEMAKLQKQTNGIPVETVLNLLNDVSQLLDAINKSTSHSVLVGKRARKLEETIAPMLKAIAAFTAIRNINTSYFNDEQRAKYDALIKSF